MIGKTLSHYKVIEKIGQGGMGEVYRAEDTNLSREVAIKVLPEQFTQDPQRLARFEREAKLLASLNHPNIAAIYGLEEAEGVRFLALELVEGETLAERVAKGAVPVEEALEVCRQIAEGVEAAHEKGVIHRDLKPANVKVTPEGKVKILDFGLAKAFEGETPVTDISQSPTLTEEMTRAGVILGTAAYMSPEQAKGKPVDKRADVFAFGAVLYELLTGKRVFEGETITETIAKVLESEPNWDALPEASPNILRTLLRRSLEKDPHHRLQHIADARILMEEALAEPTTRPTVDSAGAVQSSPRIWAMAIGLVVLTAAITGLVSWSLIQYSSNGQATLSKFEINPPTEGPFLASLDSQSFGTATPLGLAISPDGRRIVYIAEHEGTRELYLRSLDDVVATILPGTEGAQWSPSFSPDGEWVMFYAAGKLKKVSVVGGSPVTLCDSPSGIINSGGWGTNETIVFSDGTETGQALYRVSAAGGEPEILATPDLNAGDRDYINATILPGGKAVLFSVLDTTDQYQIRVLSLETREQKMVLPSARQARYIETGHLVYGQDDPGSMVVGTLMVVPFDLARLEVTGDPVPIVPGVRFTPTGFVDYAISENGTLVYLPAGVTSVPHRLVWLDRNGDVQPIGDVRRQFEEPRLSPDGTRLSVTIWDGGIRNVWVYDISRGTLSPLTDEGSNMRAIWTPDGKRLIFASNRETGVSNIFSMPTDAGDEAEQLSASNSSIYPTSLSPDGLVSYVTPGGDIGMVPFESGGEPVPILTNLYHEKNAMFSPNGQWMAFTSDRSGQAEVYVKPYPGQGGIVPISTDGGVEPVWARDGKELFYRNEDALMVVSVQTGTAFKAEKPRVLFEGSYPYNFTGVTSNYDVTPDGQKFVMVQASQEEVPTRIIVVLNWFEELKRLVPTNN